MNGRDNKIFAFPSKFKQISTNKISINTGCDAVYTVGDTNIDNTNWNQMTSTDDSECIIFDNL